MNKISCSVKNVLNNNKIIAIHTYTFTTSLLFLSGIYYIDKKNN